MKGNKINIFFPFSNKISGGGANFLELLKNDVNNSELEYTGFVESDLVLININPQNLTFKRVCFLLRNINSLNQKFILFRVDGKIKDYRGKGFLYDWYIDKHLLKIPDKIIYQSHWSKLRYKNNFKNYVIIHNYISDTTFTKRVSLKKSDEEKTNILFTSFSRNKDKGYDFLEYLDLNLDFNKFNLTCISPKGVSNYVNIIQKGLLNQDQINNEFQKSDLYLFLSKNESCSNALLEALNTNIPILFLDSGSNSEIVGTKTNSFTTKEELLKKIMVKKYQIFEPQKIKENNLKSKKEYFEQLNNQSNKSKSSIRKIETFLILTLFLFFIPFKRI